MTDASSTDSETEQSSAARFQSRAAGERCPYHPNQKDINDLVRDLSLTKSNAELLISRLKQWDLLDDSVRITSQRKRHCGFSMFYTFKDVLCYCHDIEGLFQAMGNPCNPSEWRLFVDSSNVISVSGTSEIQLFTIRKETGLYEAAMRLELITWNNNH